ncbi:SAM-dependent methyltransferase [Halarcobacter mediterraneus]|uniref:SAM-dependent methyltransferase n=1 Tax=Halarcobacter mediterraneus TaxID=2023153 RepID=A0A4Q1AZL5_9BACT|nr:class I SAM-dependent methyltransferase [Halarcobacter mediterraneus]RXK14450.1 SAM-dependent methyltransferase [Halarcobacter mediterraneus]
MKLLETNITQTIEEIYLVETFNLNNKTILELGCGNATMTKKIASNGFDRKIIACEVDEIQHKKNLEEKIENIEFILTGAENLPLEDESIDFILMFKSFHHIPKEYMKKALDEIKRVLKPNALAYISEPLYQGHQNELVSIFHDEKEVRIQAFEAIKNAVEKEEFKLFQEIFFQTEVSYENFEDFEKKQMNLSYNDNQITEELKNKVKKRYESFGGGKQTFLKPFRVDILQKV